MEVVATKEGFDGIRVRQPGETFEMPDGATSTWFEAHEAEHEVKPKGKAGGKGRAKTLSEQQSNDLA